MALSYKPLYEAVISRYEAFRKNELLGKDIVSNTELARLKDKAGKETSELTSLLEELEILKKEVNEETQKMYTLQEKLRPDLLKLEQMNRVLCLLKLLEKVKETNRRIEKNLSFTSTKSAEVESKVLDSISLLRQLSQNYHTFVGKSDFFEQYIKNLVTHWNCQLRNRLEAIFETALKNVNWPIVIPLVHVSLAPEAISAFQTSFTALLDLEKCSVEDLVDDASTGVLHICLPINIMLEHLRKRFSFHFMRNSRTNQLEKPEWYFTQVLNWIKDHEEFLKNYADPVLETRPENFPKANLQFIRGLLDVVAEKLKHDLPTLVYDDKLFTHTFDEMLLFIREIEPFFGYDKKFLHDNCKILRLFTVEPYFTKVNNLERKKSVECIESGLNSNTAWLPLMSSYDDDDDDIDELKVPECVDHFVLMLQSITGRFEYFLHISHRVAFMQLILDLLDDFRLRLSQLARVCEQEEPRWPFSQRYFSILNSLNYLLVVMNEWKTLPIFIEVAEYSLKDNIFDDSVCYLKHMIKEIQTKITSSLINQMRVKMYPYAKIKWFCYNDFDDQTDGILFELLYFISSSLNCLQKKAAHTQFNEMSALIMSGVSTLFLEDVILENKFNEEGSHRLQRDICSGFIPVFSRFTDTPELYFAEISEASKLLTLEYGTALLLQEAVRFHDDKALCDTLSELSITTLDKDNAIRILSNRLIQ